MKPLYIYIYIWKIRKDNVPPNYKIKNKCKLLNIILQWWIEMREIIKLIEYHQISSIVFQCVPTIKKKG
jgi:hypothetical protein